MIANPNTTPVQAQTATPKTNQAVQPALTAQTAAKPTVSQVKPVSSIMTSSAPTQVNQPQAVQPALVQKTPVTAPQTTVATPGITTPQTVKKDVSVTAQQAAPKVTSTVQKTQVETKQATIQRQNGAQANNAMPHQGKTDKNGVKLVGVETMPKTNNNASIRGYAMIAQVPAKSYGVDVSNYQGTDLSPYARQEAKFAIVKLTEGTGYVNPYAAGQIASAKANNMLAMGYVFAHSGGNTNEAKQEAEYGIAEAQRAGLPKRSYIAYDYEVGASGSVPANTAAIETFMQTVLQAGYLPLLYSGNAYLHAHVDVNKITNDYKGSLWVASYPTMGATSTPNWNYFPSNPGVAIWQFTDNWKGMNVDGDVTTLPLNGESSSSSTTNTTPAPSTNTGSSNNSSYKSDYHVGDQVTINPNAKTWTNGATINHAVTNGHPYTVIQVAPGDGGAVCLKDPQTGTVMGWMNDWEVTPYTAPKQDTSSQSKPATQPNSKPTTNTDNKPAGSTNQQPTSANNQSGNSTSQTDSQPNNSNSVTPAGTNNSDNANNGSGTPTSNPTDKTLTGENNSPATSQQESNSNKSSQDVSDDSSSTNKKGFDININVSAQAKAEANAAANANVNGDNQANGNGTGKGNSSSEAAELCGIDSMPGIGDVISNPMIESEGEAETISADAATIVPTSSVTATPVAGTIAPVAAAGRGSGEMPATGQTDNSVLAGLTAVAMSVLGTAGLLNWKRSKD